MVKLSDTLILRLKCISVEEEWNIINVNLSQRYYNYYVVVLWLQYWAWIFGLYASRRIVSLYLMTRCKPSAPHCRDKGIILHPYFCIQTSKIVWSTMLHTCFLFRLFCAWWLQQLLAVSDIEGRGRGGSGEGSGGEGVGVVGGDLAEWWTACPLQTSDISNVGCVLFCFFTFFY